MVVLKKILKFFYAILITGGVLSVLIVGFFISNDGYKIKSEVYIENKEDFKYILKNDSKDLKVKIKNDGKEEIVSMGEFNPEIDTYFEVFNGDTILKQWKINKKIEQNELETLNISKIEGKELKKAINKLSIKMKCSAGDISFINKIKLFFGECKVNGKNKDELEYNLVEIGKKTFLVIDASLKDDNITLELFRNKIGGYFGELPHIYSVGNELAYNKGLIGLKNYKNEEDQFIAKKINEAFNGVGIKFDVKPFDFYKDFNYLLSDCVKTRKCSFNPTLEDTQISGAHLYSPKIIENGKDQIDFIVLLPKRK